jgi:2-keto-4-pentenoate hydratase/2-oxohepta-3-ene-1,7-dioic acid hydratase in catechol pathway
MIAFNLVTYKVGLNARAGLAIGARVFDLETLTGLSAAASMLGALTEWSAVIEELERKVASGHIEKLRSIPLSECELLAPLPRPGTLFCAGANYADHMEEMARAAGSKPDPDPKSLGSRSWHFIKASGTVIGPTHTIIPPEDSSKLDWEVELAAVIGRTARAVPLSEALSYVAGYCVAIDLSARDLSRRPGMPVESPFRFDWVAHKSFDTACPMGPWLTPARFVQDPQQLAISLAVNGEVKQSSSTRKMIYSVAEQISDLSRHLTLSPGDVILTGTPAGVGAASGQYLKSRDCIRAWIESIGELECIVS